MLLLLSLYFFAVCAGENAENRLIKDLFADYSYARRPVNNHKTQTLVWLGYRIDHLSKVDGEGQQVWVQLSAVEQWKDAFLHWNKADYDGLEMIFVPYEWIWQPDTYIYNALRVSREQSENRQMPARLEPITEQSGEEYALVTLEYMVALQFNCRMILSAFPFDEHYCNTTVGSWTHKTALIDYHWLPPVPLEEQNTDQNEWEVLGIKFYRDAPCYISSFNDSEQNCYTEMNMELYLRERPEFHLIQVIIPTTVLVLVTHCGIFTHSRSDYTRVEKINVGLMFVLAFVVATGDWLPRASDPVADFTLYCFVQVCQISVATFIATILIYVQRYGMKEPVPKWLIWLAPYEFKKIEPPKEREEYFRALPEFWKPRQLPYGVGLSENVHDIKLLISEMLSILQVRGMQNEYAMQWMAVLDRIDRILLAIFIVFTLFTTLILVRGWL